MAQESWLGARQYDRFMGRWSRPASLSFLRWLSPTQQQRWVDVGCGTGAFTRAILEETAPAQVMGIDPSESFLESAREQLPETSFQVGHGDNLPCPDYSADWIVSAFALNFMPDPVAGLVEMKRVAASAGRVGAMVWDYAGEMQFLRIFWDAVVELDPAARSLDEGVRFPLCQPENLHQAFASAGLSDIEISPIDIPTVFLDFADYWEPFLGGPFPAPAYVLSLPEAKQRTLRDALYERLPFAEDGSIPLRARAWVVQGSK